MDFITVDVETPNSKNNSICAMGLTFVKNDCIVFTRMVLINPRAPFSQTNTDIHGISSDTVQFAPTFDKVWRDYERYFRHYPVVMHNCAFDTSVISKDAKRYGIELPPMDVYCTMRLYKYNYPEYGHYSLDSLADRFSLSLDHHQCDSDTCVTAQLMLRLLADENTCIFSSNAYCYTADSVAQSSAKSPAQASRTAAFLRGGSGDRFAPSLSYSQDAIVFTDKRFAITGDIDGYSRQEIINKITARNGIFSTAVSSRTDYLIVGTEDRAVVGDDGKSSKIKAAEILIADGKPIRIIEASHLLSAFDEL